ncbi:hypothetical protein NZK27_00675 [Synechococcus sp. FGCU-3]|nr:hypothetical protein [Synechococcus sp. FGCU3]
MPLARESLDELLSGYRRPNDKVSEWLREGALQPLRRGLYLTGPALRHTPACLPLLANHLVGPSYVSLNYALALHGLIPEGVAEITSVTPRPSRTLSNSYGRFSYSHLPLRFLCPRPTAGRRARRPLLSDRQPHQGTGGSAGAEPKPGAAVACGHAPVAAGGFALG